MSFLSNVLIVLFLRGKRMWDVSGNLGTKLSKIVHSSSGDTESDYRHMVV